MVKKAILSILVLLSAFYYAESLMMMRSNKCQKETIAAAPAGVVTSGLTHWWKFENNLDDSIGTNNLVSGYESPGAGITYTTGKEGSYCSVYDLHSWAYSTSTEAFAVGGDVTFDFWLYSGFETDAEPVLCRYNASDPYYLMYVYTSSTIGGISNSVFRYNADNDDGVKINTWLHVAFVIDFTNKICKTYIDNNAAVSSGATLNTNKEINEFILGTLSSPLRNAQTYKGRLDSFKVYNRAITSTEVLQNYNAEK